MVEIKAYDEMMAALLKFHRSVSQTSEEMSQQVRAMRDVMDDDYARAGNELIGSYEALYRDLGVDAEPVYDLIERLNDELTQNCQELLDLGAYCETLAKEMEEKLGTRISAKTNFI